MSPFEPAGDVPRWRTLYAVLKPLKAGDVVTYETLCAALEVPEEARHVVQGAIRRAAREFEVQDRHALEPVPNVGYRVVQAEEHLTLARKHQRKAGRSLARGHSKTVNVDLSGVDPETRKAFGVVAQAFAAQMDFNRRLDVRQKNLEAQLGLVSKRTDRSESEIAELKARLARLENREPDPGLNETE